MYPPANTKVQKNQRKASEMDPIYHFKRYKKERKKDENFAEVLFKSAISIISKNSIIYQM